MTSDEITLTLPRERPYYPIAELVVSGLAARHDVTFEHLDDLELALEGLLDRLDGHDPAMLRLRVDDNAFRASIGPYGEQLRAELGREAGQEIGLRRLLDAVVDAYKVVDGDGGHWIELTKAVR